MGYHETPTTRGQTARNDMEFHNQYTNSWVIGVCQCAAELCWKESSQSDAHQRRVGVNEDLTEIADGLCITRIPFKAFTGRKPIYYPASPSRLTSLNQLGAMGATEGDKLASRVFKDFSIFDIMKEW